MAQRDLLRVSRELAQLEKGKDLSIAIGYRESDMRNVRALIVGPPGTPYEYGFFEFDVEFGPEYPPKPPKVTARTTNHGRCRFNPNIYSGGKVCLSILGTWSGEKGEEWSAAQGLESVLLSIQSLMSNNPYENEPGYEDAKGEKDKEVREAYCAKIRHETLRIAVIDKMETVLQLHLDRHTHEKSSSAPEEDSDKEAKTQKLEPFNDLFKQRFLWYYESYLTTIEENALKHKEGTSFALTPFESTTNSMSGTFQYVNLGKRLVRIKETLYRETADWAVQGLRATEQELTIAYNLQTQFEEFAGYQKRKNIHNIDVSLLDNNPFVWIMTYFGKAGSHLDGGLFKIRISLSPKFPQERPRVMVENRLYHYRVSKNGVLCYFPSQSEDIKHHIEAIIQAIEEDSPPYDPRAIVNPKATNQFWGSEEDKKDYRRAQRKCAQDSMDIL